MIRKLRNGAILLFLALSMTACQGTIRFKPIPAEYLHECVLPPKPKTNRQLADRYGYLYECAENHNIDKQKIKELLERDR